MTKPILNKSNNGIITFLLDDILHHDITLHCCEQHQILNNKGWRVTFKLRQDGSPIEIVNDLKLDSNKLGRGLYDN